MQNENHIINKQVFEFSCSRYEDAFQLQKQMESGLQHSIQSRINDLFNEWNDTAEILLINKLEIDVGEIAFDRLAELLPGKIYSALANKFSAKLIAGKSPADIVQKNRNNNTIELLEIFLLSGTLPWWAGTSISFSLAETIEWLIENDKASLQSLLLKHIRNEKFTERLVHQTDASLLKKITDLMPAATILHTAFRGVVPSAFVNDDRTELLQAKTNAVIPGKENQLDEKLSKNISKLILKLIADWPLPGSVEQLKLFIKEKVAEVFGKATVAGSVEELINKAVASAFHPRAEVLEEDMNSIARPAFFLSIDLLVEMNDHLVEIFKKNTDHISRSEDFLFDENSLAASGEKIYLQNAGLVLIASFFPSLFKELQWTDEGEFISWEARVKALFLLHYIATGADAAPEYTLQLNKILCGIKLDEPIPFSVELTKREKQEADQLLQDVIGHWAALKSSTPEALRGSFLLREGLLSYNNGRWLLQVERTGYDVLLDNIPWSWATIKFGWMDSYLETEW